MVNVKLQTQITWENIPMLSRKEILDILRAADDISGSGGRTLLAKILKGSRDKKVLQLGLDKNPAYGSFTSFKMEEIIVRIDWMIHHDFFEIEYSGKLPMIVFTGKGWIIERDQYAGGLLRQWDEWLINDVTSASMEYLKDQNRGLILLFLEKIRNTSNKQYIPFLKQWEQIDYKKVRQVIRHVINCLERPDDVHGPVELAPTEDVEEQFRIESYTPERLKCWECGKRFIWEIEEQKFFKSKGFVPPKRCPSCREKKWLREMGIDLNEE